jgi:cache domain-containing protein/GAF domain-containing protein
MTASVESDTRTGCEIPDALADDSASATPSSTTRSRLFTRYDALLVAIVGTTLLAGGIYEVFTHYREHRASLIRLQHEQATAAAAKISQFIEDIEGQLGWTTQTPWTAGASDSRRFDALRLLRQVPAITELVMVDAAGKERLRVSRLAMDVVDSGTDLSQDPKFTEAIAHKVYFGPVYFRKESEPYMTIALAGGRKDSGVSIAEINLKLIWDLVSRIKVGQHGHAYIVSGRGRLIAHPDMGLVLRDTDMSKLAPVQAAAADSDMMSDALDGGENLSGQQALTAFAPIRPLRWTMFVERPADEAYAPLYAALQRLTLAMLAAAIFAVLAAILMTRRVVAMPAAQWAWGGQAGSAAVTQGFSASPQVGFAQSAAKAREPVGQATPAPAVLDVVGRSAGGLQEALDALAESAARLCSADCAALDRTTGEELRQIASFGFSPEFKEWRRNKAIPLDQGAIVGRAFIARKPVQILDVVTDLEFTELEAQRRGGFRTVLAVPLMRDGEPTGVLLMTRGQPKLFSEEQIDLATTLANIAAMMIESVQPLQALLDGAGDTRAHR